MDYRVVKYVVKRDELYNSSKGGYEPLAEKSPTDTINRVADKYALPELIHNLILKERNVANENNRADESERRDT